MLVRFELDDAVGEVVLDRPEKLNAMSGEMVGELNAALDAAEGKAATREVRCLLVRGEGRAYSAGRDLNDAQPGEDAQRILDEVFNPLMARVAAFPAPTMAAVQGACLGTGLGLALACDVVFVAEDAKVGSPFARIGAVLDSGGHHAFVARLGRHRALELIYTGRLLSGVEAATWGLVNAAVPADALLEHARGVARQIANGPTVAFLESKHLVRRIVDEGLTFGQVLAAEAQAQGRAAQTDDYAEGMRAFQEKRKPAFRGI